MPLGAHKAALMGVAGASVDNVVLLSSQTGAGVTSISFTSQITSKYPVYLFKCYNINISAGNSYIQWQCNAVGESDYNESINSSALRSWHYEDDSVASLEYKGDWDQKPGDNIFQYLLNGNSADADSSENGELWMFNPSSTTYNMKFMSRFIGTGHTHATTGPASNWQAYSGYISSAVAIDDVKFTGGPSTTFDGTIKLWGIK